MLRQSGSLSPLLFTIYMDNIIKECNQTVNRLHVGYKNMQTVNISEYPFANDVVLVAKNAGNLQTNVEI